jgi:hypothetical protein
MTLSWPPPTSWSLSFALGCLLLFVFQVLAAAFRRWRRRGVLRARFRSASQGERAALTWLREMGFDVLGAQVAAQYPLLIDGAAKTIGVRADYLVAKDNRRYVVEVKTGALAPRIETPATRRQLLEYLVVFEVDGALLLDVDARSLREIAFPQLQTGATPAPRTGALAWLGWVACAIAIAWIMYR